MTVYAITDTKKGRTGIAPTYLQTTRKKQWIILTVASKLFGHVTFYAADEESGLIR